MLNKVSDGKNARYTAAANVKSGSIVSYLGKIGIATQDIASGATGLLDMEGGVYEFKTSSAIGSQSAGTKVYVPASPSDGSNIAATSATNAVLVGVLEEATAASQTTIQVRLA